MASFTSKPFLETRACNLFVRNEFDFSSIRSRSSLIFTFLELKKRERGYRLFLIRVLSAATAESNPTSARSPIGVRVGT